MAARNSSKARSSNSRRPSSRSRGKRRPQNNLMVLKLLILVIVVLVLFEGQLVYRMFTQHTSAGNNTATVENTENPPQEGTVADTSSDVTNTSSDASAVPSDGEAAADPSVAGTDGEGSIVLAGFSANGDYTETPDTASQTVEPDQPVLSSAEHIDSPALVPKQVTSVDDSFFSDAVFIGDSRMEGFRNTSGITQGTFLTSVGMSIDALPETRITTPDGNITVYQALSGRQYSKIYMMLGTNDLGYFPWEMFLDDVETILGQFHKLQPNAVIYICSVIYVEESKTTTEYVTNANVITVNNYLLEACEDLDYCHYINLNEMFNDGSNSLLPGASQDGVHLYEKYTKMMLQYLKNHYI